MAEGAESKANDRPLVYAIVLNWNGWRHTFRCLESLDRLEYPNVRVLVVDNASTDGSEGHIRAARPGQEVIQTGENLGYGGGNNVGINIALERAAEYVWVLNNDTELPPDGLSVMVEIMEADPRIGILGLDSLDENTGEREEVGPFPAGLPRPSQRPGLVAAPGCPFTIELMDHVHGSCLLVRREVLERAGAFDLRYFHFWEDIELCWRVWQAGWLVARTSAARIRHRTGSSTAGANAMRTYYNLRNLMFFLAAATGTRPPRAMFRTQAIRIWGPCVLGVRGFFRPGYKIAVVRALRDAAWERGGKSRTYSPR
jgi:GT2 family glycosyltransferase